MIYITIYFLISGIITIATGQMLINRVGSLDYAVEALRMLDTEFNDVFKDKSNKEIITALMITGFLVSPIIALVWFVREYRR